MKIKQAIKTAFDPFIKFIVVNKYGWKISGILLRFADWLRFNRSKYDQLEAGKKLAVFFNDKVVKNGFFKGMNYNSLSSVGSSIFPKLLGSYECELYPVFSKLKGRNYRDILDIGCAEGFYAVGLAIQFPEATITGYDIDREAIRLCSELAICNHVEDRVILKDECTAATLASFNYTGPALILCDCEGFEKELFTSVNIQKIAGADIIVELHPFFAPGIKEYLTQLFANTHDLSVVSSHDNNRKIFDFQESLRGMNAVEQLKAVEEGRPFTMEWLIAESKSNKI